MVPVLAYRLDDFGTATSAADDFKAQGVTIVTLWSSPPSGYCSPWEHGHRQREMLASRQNTEKWPGPGASGSE